MVTLAPLWVTVPFQICETVWPLAKAKVKAQLLSAVVPVFCMEMAVPNPPPHWLAMV
jgi:hypothetical protein